MSFLTCATRQGEQVPLGYFRIFIFVILDQIEEQGVADYELMATTKIDEIRIAVRVAIIGRPLS
jgi:hypothetical protein